MTDFMGKKRILYLISGPLFILGILALAVYGLKPGIDFTGGSLIELEFSGTRPSSAEVQATLAPLNLGTIVVQAADTQGLIMRLPFLTEEQHQNILTTLRGKFVDTSTSTVATATSTPSTPTIVEKSFETIGSTVSNQLKSRASQASILIMLVIIGFIAYAFRKVSRPVASWKYGVTAVVAMVHDVVLTASVFALLGKYFNVEVDIAFVVAMLTVFGYSVHDTIVVFDRIRENVARHSAENFPATVNAAINETFGRSINTSLTTLIVLTALYLLGGASIKYFALALIIGIFLGTYSSIFIASALLVSWYEWGIRRRNR